MWATSEEPGQSGYIPSLVRRTYVKYGVFHFLLMILLAGTVIVMIWKQHMSLANAVLILGIVGAISIVANQDEIRFRDQRRTAMTEVVALAERYNHCFGSDGTSNKATEVIDENFDLLQAACMKLHLLVYRQETQDSLDRLIARLGALRDRTANEFVQAEKDYHNSLQDFILKSRRELGLPDGKPEYR